MTPPWRQEPERTPTTRERARARTLRRALTEPEKRLWWHLRHRLPVEGTHFRRQVPIGPYIADFCCLRARLVIEVDGHPHGFAAKQAHDDKRTQHLNGLGYRVIRFGNAEVMRSIDGVLETILSALGGTTPTPDPSPQGGGECTAPPPDTAFLPSRPGSSRFSPQGGGEFTDCVP